MLNCFIDIEKRKSKEVDEETRRSKLKNLVKGLTDLTLMRGTRGIGTIQCQDNREELEAHLKRYSTLTTTMILATEKLHAMHLALSTSAEAPHSSTMTTTTVEAHLQCMEEMDQLDHHQATPPGIHQVEEAQEEDQDHHQEEETEWTLVTSTCLTDLGTTLEIAPSEWTRSETSLSKTCTPVPLTRLRETELSEPRRVSSRESAETPETSLRPAIRGTEEPKSGHFSRSQVVDASQKFIKSLNLII